MKRFSHLGVFIALCYSSVLWAQQVPPLERYAPEVFVASSQKITSGTLRIVALMVEFEPEENRFTSGNGTFNLPFLQGNDIVIDPLPHDQGYFEAQLAFARNYFLSASRNTLSLDITVLPQVVQLERVMSSYSPIGRDLTLENVKLAELSRDAWLKADQLGIMNGVQTDASTMFVVFHAGVGRDLNLLGTTLVKTPQDIPSVYLSLDSFRRLWQNPSFSGINLPNSGLTIANTTILPSTESRLGEVFGEEYVLQLSMKGLLCAMIGNHIGLPDLYNTETGRSGIGRFGLMDPESFFSWYGLLPPLPSAWERAYMGWDVPTEITGQFQAHNIPSPLLQQAGSILKYHISADEYFLIENRHRDALGNGITLHIRTPDGSTVQRTFTNQDTFFTPNDTDSLFSALVPGVITQVDNLDFSLPGGLDPGPDGRFYTPDDRFLNGGILIWHIDESVIRERMNTNSINNAANRRGVSLMEADGAQDIGFDNPLLGLDQVGRGTAYDFWWSGNTYTVITLTGREIVFYQNRFGKDTTPSNRSNSGQLNPFEFYNFSDALPTAQFAVRSIDLVQLARVRTLPVHQLGLDVLSSSNRQSFPLGIKALVQQADTLLLIPHLNGLATLDMQANALAPSISMSRTHQPLYYQQTLVLSQQYDTKAPDGSISAYSYQNGAWQPIWQHLTEGASLGLPFALQGAVTLPFEEKRFSISDGSISTPSSTGYPLRIQQNEFGRMTEFDVKNSTETPIYFSEIGQFAPFSLAIPVQPSQQADVLIYLNDVRQRVLTQDGHILFESSQPLEYPLLPAFGDVTGDNFIDMVIFDGNFPRLINTNGAIQAWNVDHHLVTDARPVASPLLADVTGDGKQDVFLFMTDGYSYLVYGFDASGTPLEGFPLLAGSAIPSVNNGQTFLVNPVFHGNSLFTVSATGELKAWTFDNMGEIHWSGLYGNTTDNLVYSGVEMGTPNQGSIPILNTKETYNWPNPASSITHIRYQTAEPSRVDILIIDYNGNKLKQLSLNSRGGQPEEIPLEVGQWANGVYVARIKATTSTGKSVTHLFKIAVMR